MKTARPAIGMEVQMDARPPHEPPVGSRRREEADFPGLRLLPPPHVGGYGSGVQLANLSGNSHPSPLPWGEGDASDANQIFGCPGQFRRLTFMVVRRLTTTRDTQSTRKRQTFLPLLGERAGVRASVGLISLLLLSVAVVHAQSYSIDWFKIAGGGGTSTGGVYSLSGTIGQSDASGALNGGNYSVTGGFWSLIAVVQTPGAPLLTITRSGANLIISWPSPSTGFSLQQNTNLTTTNWTSFVGPVGDDGTTKSVTNSPPTGTKFFRLIQP